MHIGRTQKVVRMPKIIRRDLEPIRIPYKVPAKQPAKVPAEPAKKSDGN